MHAVTKLKAIDREADLRRQVKAAGGLWDGLKRPWIIRRDRAVELGWLAG
ncbi:MAG: hypothetical protein HY023_15915 [Chloroflexi bacterium]|nr:hypothetical protein [Chloroflexota bacterium]